MLNRSVVKRVSLIYSSLFCSVMLGIHRTAMFLSVLKSTLAAVARWAVAAAIAVSADRVGR